MIKKSIDIQWPGREEIHVGLELDENNNILKVDVSGIGGTRFLIKLKEFRQNLKGTIAQLEVPQGSTREDIFFREVVLKLKDQWNFPFQEEELCHCRAVLAQTVDQAICAGAHSAKTVSRLTSASTACGTCRPDVEEMIRYRLGLSGSGGNSPVSK